MPEHFLKQLEVSQIQCIGTNNWDVLLNKLENDTINTSCQEEKRQYHKCNNQYVSDSMRARKLNRMATKKATKTV